MNSIFRLLFLIILHLAILLPAKLELKTSNKNLKVYSLAKENSHRFVTSRKMDMDNINDDIWIENFENGVNGWSLDSGWQLSTNQFNSESHSMLSADDGTTGNFQLTSPLIQLPNIGLTEVMLFSFFLKLDMPDSDGNKDELLDDYYQVQLKDYSNKKWHVSNYNAKDLNSYWCGDDNINGYQDAWIQFIDTPEINIASTGYTLSAEMMWNIENDMGPFVEGSCTDGWDAINVRISKDNGTTWALLHAEGSGNSYDFDCGYGWIYNDSKYEIGGSLDHLAAGWGNNQDWTNISFDLGTYAGEDVIIRFAFGSDPAYSTTDNGDGTPKPELIGVFIDNITIKDASDVNIVSYTAEDGSNDLMTSSGYSIEDIFSSDDFTYFDQYCFDREADLVLTNYTSEEACVNASYEWLFTPGSMGWEKSYKVNEYNFKEMVNLHDYIGHEVNFLFRTIYDNNTDGGNGEGLYIDDIAIYKESGKVYAQPHQFQAEVLNDAVQLTWYDMNQSGVSTIIFDNDDISNFSGLTLSDCSDCLAFAGALFPAWLGPCSVDSISIYNINEPAVDITVNAYSFDEYAPVQTIDVILSDSGWNTFDVSWDFSSEFLIAHSFNDEIAAAFDPTTGMAGLWVLSNDVGLWERAYQDAGYIAGNWAIRAKVSYDGLSDITYNLYRDAALIQTGLMEGSYTDSDIEYETDYSYKLGVVYSNGIEIISAESITISTPLPPLPEGVIELSYDDDSFESEFNSDANNYSAVKFAPDFENTFLYMIKWYQIGSGGAFYIKIWDNAEKFIDCGVDNDGDVICDTDINWDDEFGNGVWDEAEIFTDTNGNGVWDANIGLPGNEIYSVVQAAGNQDGWNQKILSSDSISFSGNFWIGAKEFSTSKPFGLDTGSNSGNTYQRDGLSGDWLPVQGNLAFRAYFSSEPLEIENFEIPIKFGIREIFPNPFNPIANIHFEISELTQVILSIYDLNGRLVNIVLDDILNPGDYTSVWSGTDRYGYQVSSGIYLAVLESEGWDIQTRKLVLLK